MKKFKKTIFHTFWATLIQEVIIAEKISTIKIETEAR